MALTAYGRRLTPLELNDRLRTEGDNGFRGGNVQFIGPTYVLSGLRQGNNKRTYENPVLDATTWDSEDQLSRIDRNLKLPEHRAGASRHQAQRWLVQLQHRAALGDHRAAYLTRPATTT